MSVIFLGRGFWVLLACTLALSGSLLGTAASSAASPEDLSLLFRFGPDGSETTDFEHLGGIAVDQEDEFVYALDVAAGTLKKFGSDGQPVDFTSGAAYLNGNSIEGLDPFALSAPAAQVAVDSTAHTIYVTDKQELRAFQANGEPVEFTAGPGAGTSRIPGFTELYGVEVDENGNIYASDHAGVVSIFAPSGALLTSFSAANAFNLAVGPGGDVFVLSSEGSGLPVRVLKFSPDLFPVGGATSYTETTFIPDAPFLAGISIDPTSGNVYVLRTNFTRTWVLIYDAAGTLMSSIGEPGTTGEAMGLKGNSEGIAVWGEGREVGPKETVDFFAGDTSAGDGVSKVAAFGTKIVVGPPTIENTSVLDITSDSATLRSWINPNTATSTYHFEYGPQGCGLGSCTTVPLGGGNIGDGQEPIKVFSFISGLQPNATYQYRVIAENSLGSTTGPWLIFTTQPLGLTSLLADSRVWEMVSPADKNGGMPVSFLGLTQAAADGGGLAFLSLGAIENDPEGNRASEASSVIARRSAGGWQSRDITPSNNRNVGILIGGEGEYKLYNANLSRALVTPRDGTLLSTMASDRTPYLREDGEPPIFIPLLTTKEGFANVPPGTEFGGGDSAATPVHPVGASPDLSSVALESSHGLLLTAAPPHTADLGERLYIWVAGEVKPVGVLPVDEGEEMPPAVLGSGAGSVQHAISSDGSRVFWSRILTGNPGSLYMRDLSTDGTVRLDVAKSGPTGSGTPNPVFQGANADGTVVFFTDPQQLTADASPAGSDLYRCEIPSSGPAAGCASLTNVSATLADPDESAEVQGLASGVSEDGKTIYFVAKGVLDTEPNQYDEAAIAAQPNLYVWQEGQGVRFVASLGEKDHSTWGLPTSGGAGVASFMTAAVSPSGRYLSFMSQRILTGFVNVEARNGDSVQEVYRYDAASDRLDCVSCNPWGAAPHGETPKLQGFVDHFDQYQHIQAAATLPSVDPAFRFGPLLYRARTALDNGRIFFNAFDSLVPADANGEWDVYQYEPFGVGSCGVSSGEGAATARTAGGCVSLLSSGTGVDESGFLDASISGDDVFFITRSKLSTTDVDEQPDIYDARVNGGFPTLLPPHECQGEGCRSAGTGPSIAIPGSATFHGPGNLKRPRAKRCAKGKRKVRRHGHLRCVTRGHRNTQKHPNAGRSGRAER